jgi:hypothetical protein
VRLVPIFVGSFAGRVLHISMTGFSLFTEILALGFLSVALDSLMSPNKQGGYRCVNLMHFPTR